MKLAGLATLIWDLAPSHAGRLSRPSLSVQIPACTCPVRESAQFCRGTGSSHTPQSHVGQAWMKIRCNKDRLARNSGMTFDSGDEFSLYRYVINCGLTVNHDDCKRSNPGNGCQMVPHLFQDIRLPTWDQHLAVRRTPPVAIAATALKLMDQPSVTTEGCYCC